MTKLHTDRLTFEPIDLDAEKAKGLTRHALSSDFGDMPKSEHEALQADLLKVGQLESVKVAGKSLAVVDGWQRHTAMLAVGLTPRYEIVTGTPQALRFYVDSLNYHRRHLAKTKRQERLVAIAVDLKKAAIARAKAGTGVGASKAARPTVARQLKAEADKQGLKLTGRDSAAIANVATKVLNGKVNKANVKSALAKANADQAKKAEAEAKKRKAKADRAEEARQRKAAVDALTVNPIGSPKATKSKSALAVAREKILSLEAENGRLRQVVKSLGKRCESAENEVEDLNAEIDALKASTGAKVKAPTKPKTNGKEAPVLPFKALPKKAPDYQAACLSLVREVESDPKKAKVTCVKISTCGNHVSGKVDGKAVEAPMLPHRVYHSAGTDDVVLVSTKKATKKAKKKTARRRKAS